MPEGFETNGVWKARGRGFQMGTIQPHGVVVHLTGQVAWDADEQIVGRGDIGAQARQCFENIALLLSDVGGSLSDVVSITTYYTDQKQLAVIQTIRLEYLDAASAPVSTSVMVAGLGHADFLVELTAIAAIPHERFRAPK